MSFLIKALLIDFSKVFLLFFFSWITLAKARGILITTVILLDTDCTQASLLPPFQIKSQTSWMLFINSRCERFKCANQSPPVLFIFKRTPPRPRLLFINIVIGSNRTKTSLPLKDPWKSPKLVYNGRLGLFFFLRWIFELFLWDFSW